MKKIIFAIILTADAFGVHAENAGITTSQYYVDSKSNEKQDAAPANDANSVMTYDSTATDGVGAKAIYNSTTSYETQKKSLVTAGVANAAIQNAINMEFTCANPPKCNLWNITSVIPSRNLLNPVNIHQGTISSGVGTHGVVFSPRYNRCYFDFIPVHAGDKVNFTSLNGTPPAYQYIWLYSDQNEESYARFIHGSQILPDANHSGYQFTIPQDGYVRGIWLSNEYNFTTNDIKEPMIEISPTPSPYEPYQPIYLPENQ